MPQFLITYLGSPKPSSPEEGQRLMSQYNDWISSLGDAAVSPTNPIKNTKTVHPDGTVSNDKTSTMSGFTIIQAESEEATLAIAKSCPYLEIGGSLEVSEMIKMPG